ncbi:ActS/PrrB/RegB family redox-sensitive histidine kinase [Defluviimonas sp. WL0002]|uniref:histidine kinase n=1 Tax=Albidovulum marisflavi TaxID=2984159 RepID=A0ABT2Z860_9RHOB|nr:ActS/PrrB/RegB family redox-sensitive histidine kinase [Defluviimonas sp. WL0002]MCV2867257.1 ActS/PrrB/RegB family redox-sensitive histidine kinase [Defluviimonas sp. WL0002]
MTSSHPQDERDVPVEFQGVRVRLRTLILLRWAAIAGQVAALTVASGPLNLAIPLGPCFLLVGLAIAANMAAITVFPETKRLSEGQTLASLLFDTAQLAVLLSLTGGLSNPFAFLILAPATIGATVLGARSSVAIALVTIAVVTMVAWFHLPLRTDAGVEIATPAMLSLGHWLAIVIGVTFLSIYAGRVASEIRSMSRALLATQMALAREQKLTDLGGVVAAAAHELGTPLATIKLVSAELADELDDRPEQRDDALLIRREADRCAEILRSMGRAGKDDLHLRAAPVSAVLREAAEPHLDRGRDVRFELSPAAGGSDREPTIRRRPEVIHGLRNLIQNAVDFARATVWVEARWSAERLVLRIVDDGNGFPPHLLGRIGDPFIRRRPAEPAPGRPEYDGMGLGLFIAKTLLERTGAEITFANGSDPFLAEAERPERCGAIVEVVWPLSRIGQPSSGPLGENLRH